jgi:monoamine oxidase
MSTMTRRDLLRTLAAAAGASAVCQPGSPAAAVLQPGVAVPPPPRILDVAIVGAGVSGAYAAWRLLGESPASPVLAPVAAGRGDRRLAVALFERSHRIGGRLRSLLPPDMPHLRAELGGMRFPTTHTLVARLVEHLGLAVKPFPVGNDANFLYLRGCRLRQKQWRERDALPYQLAPADRGKSADDLLIEAIEHHVPAARTLVGGEWDAVKTAPRRDGPSLAQIGLWTALLRAKGSEALKLIEDAGGYSSFYRSWSAAEMMPWIMADFLGSPVYLTLRDGYDSIPRRLVFDFVEAGGAMCFGHQLKRVRRAPHPHEDVLALDFAAADGKALPTRYARHVVLALPKVALEQVASDRLALGTASFRDCIGAVTPQPAAKIFLVYKQPWWRELGITGGRSTTDLPIRQCYYVGTEGAEPGADPSSGTSLLMASYHDDDNVHFWNAYGTPRSMTQPMWLDASRPMFQEAQRQIRELHGPGADIPDAIAGCYANWQDEPFGGGWHFWNVQTRPAEIIPRVRRPDPDAHLYVCGEAYSTDQGWVRGALRSAERMLQTHFKAPPPSWLPADEPVGP